MARWHIGATPQQHRDPKQILRRSTRVKVIRGLTVGVAGLGAVGLALFVWLTVPSDLGEANVGSFKVTPMPPVFDKPVLGFSVGSVQNEAQEHRAHLQNTGTNVMHIAPGTCITVTDLEGNIEGTCKIAPAETAHSINSPFG